MRMARSTRVWTSLSVLLVALVALRVPVRAQQDEDLGPRGGADFEARTISVGGVERSYGIHIPANVANPAAVVLLFHGGGGRPQAIARRSGMTELADQKGFIAVYPMGEGRGEDGREGGGRGEGGPGGGRGEGRGTWNVGGTQSVSAADDVAFVKAILTDIEQKTPIDHNRIYATGISMGGVFAYRLACEMSDTFAAIAPVAATMVDRDCRPSSPVAVFHIHGADDDRIPLKGGHGARTASERSWPAPQNGITAWRRFDSCGGNGSKTTDGDATCTIYDQCSAPVEYCVIAGQGHQWPDNAADRIWAFFAAHPKQQAAAR